ncbi:AUXIN-RESPONSIVE FAMILY PROTEIN [Salix viminalis]|uniref:AUXIN-RESPONSIVE FAMILY PROTEIN n=1 Tax=Salix viminalis TaxID=40686 RepID=A0A9Q0NKQ9_SALVM|nr:AUXIN-RESPONSIVE FAMILY PROTEIN [Salix viminalis]
MINLMKLVKFAKKWKKLAAPERKRISIPRSGEDEITDNNDRLPVASKGHFVVYTVDQRRFEFPISYLNNNIFRELLAMSEEEFGLPRNGPITLLCDAMFMKYAASLMQRNFDKDMERALLIDIASSSRCSLSFHSLLQERSNQQLLVC